MRRNDATRELLKKIGEGEQAALEELFADGSSGKKNDDRWGAHRALRLPPEALAAVNESFALRWEMIKIDRCAKNEEFCGG